MDHVGMMACPSCGGRAARGAAFCPRCGAALRGAARLLGVLPAVFTGGFVAASSALIQLVLERLLDASSRLSPSISGYCEVIGHLIACSAFLFVGVGSALGASKLLRPSRVLRAALVAGVSALALSSQIIAGRFLGGWLGLAAASGIALVASVGVVLGPTIVRWASSLAPFSWAAKVVSDCGSVWCFAVVVMGMQAVFLLAPWLLVWIAAGALALKLTRRSRGHSLDHLNSSGLGVGQVPS